MVLGDQLTSLLDRAKTLYEAPSASALSSPARPTINGVASPPQLKIPSSPIPTSPADQPSSPGFILVADSDDDSDSSRPNSPTPAASSVSEATSSTAPTVPRIVIPARSPLEVVGDEADESSALSPRSPMGDQSRSLTLEEGEVFRKGAALGTGEVDEEGLGDVSGEELRKEVSRD